MKEATQNRCKTQISYSELVTDAVRACSDSGGLGGLLVVGGDEQDAQRLRGDFSERTLGKYPTIVKSREEFEQSAGNRQIGDRKLYCVELDKIQLV